MTSAFVESPCIETVFSQLIDANTSRPTFYSVIGLVGAEFPACGNTLSPIADHEHKCFTLFLINCMLPSSLSKIVIHEDLQIICALSQ